MAYLVSLWMVTLRMMGLYFFNSIRSVVFFLFLVVMYREVPGSPDVLCSVHSMITWMRLPLAFLAIASAVWTMPLSHGGANVADQSGSTKRMSIPSAQPEFLGHPESRRRRPSKLERRLQGNGPD
jgi:hypothetical protein